MAVSPYAWRASADETECGFRWTTGDANGPHVCRKAAGHVRDVTNDEHRCCCNANTWSYEDE